LGHTDDEVDLQKLRRGNHRCKEAAKPKVRPNCRNPSYGTEDRIRIIISESFTTSSMAEKNGQDSAREWIDKHLK
jgi:hypothetical protein